MLSQCDYITTDMIDYALEQDMETAAWDIWITMYPSFNKDNFVPFSEFKAKSTKNKIMTAKTFDEIEREMSAIEAAYKSREGATN